jgi:CRP-like cAMP-binding protein/predicted MFS family arabinose efflux permease
MTSLPATAHPSAPSPLAVFRNRSFSLMWSGELISTIGTALSSLAASILIFRLTGSALSVGLMLMATAAPSLLVGLVAGVFVDRYDRQRIMIAADLLRAAIAVLIPFLVANNVLWLYVMVALSSAIGQFFEPAHSSVLPEVASDEELAAANSLMAISSFGSTAIGFAASGLIASRYPIAWAFYADALSFVFSAACILLIRLKPLAAPDEAVSVAVVARNLRAGLRFLFDTPMLKSLLLSSLPVIIGFGLSNALLLPFALRALHATEFEYGLQEGVTSIGFVIGSLLMANLSDRWREGQWLALSFTGMALAGVAYAFSTTVPWAILFVAISGFLNAPSSIARRLIIQRHSPREMRGRVNSAFFVSRDVLFLIGMAGAGLADVVDVRLMYLVSAVMILIGGVWVLFLPGLGQPAAEWRRLMSLLVKAPAAPGLGAGRAATLADLDSLAVLLPTLAGLSAEDRKALAAQGRVIEAPAGARVVQRGQAGDAAYFVLAGRLAAGLPAPDGTYRALSTLAPGDFFGEIAALTGATRTADVAADQASTLLQVPAPALRALMRDPAISRLVLDKMSERLARTHLSDLPRFAGLDPEAMRDLRTPQGEP